MARIISVRIVAGLIIVVNAANAYDLYAVHKAGYTSWLSIIEVSASLLLAIGIFMLSETARSLYVLFAGIMVVLSIVGLLMFIPWENKLDAARAAAPKQTKAQLEQNITAVENSRYLSPDVKQRSVQAYQRQIDNLSGSSVISPRTKQYLSEGLLFAIALFPLFFFTRPSIKEVFN